MVGPFYRPSMRDGIVHRVDVMSGVKGHVSLGRYGKAEENTASTKAVRRAGARGGGLVKYKREALQRIRGKKVPVGYQDVYRALSTRCLA